MNIHSYLVSLLFAAPFLVQQNCCTCSIVFSMLYIILYNHPLLSLFIDVNPQDVAQVTRHTVIDCIKK